LHYEGRGEREAASATRAREKGVRRVDLTGLIDKLSEAVVRVNDPGLQVSPSAIRDTAADGVVNLRYVDYGRLPDMDERGLSSVWATDQKCSARRHDALLGLTTLGMPHRQQAA